MFSEWTINPFNMNIYKNSQFNVFFYHENKMIGYNGFTDEFLLLNPELHAIYDAISKTNEWSELKEVHPDFFNHLLKTGFIVSEDTNEVEKVKNVVREAEQEQEKSYILTINPTMNCNFKCWYCYETHIKASKMTLETIESVCNHVKWVLDTKPNLQQFTLSWFGGEPLLYFHKTVVPILEKIAPLFKTRNVNFSSGFTTNGFLIDQKTVDICKENNSAYFQITLDGHRERHNQVRYVSKERGSYDEIISNIRLCLKNEANVSVRVNVSEETLENVIKISEDFQGLSAKENEYLNFSFHEVWQEEKELTRDIQEVVNAFRDKGFNTLFQGVNIDTMRNSCYADKRNHATINYNGDVFKCTARDFESSSREGTLGLDGEITWNEIYEKRMNSKFKNAPCLSCKLLPVCNGGCTQQALEHNEEYCLYDFDAERKTDIIRDKYLYYIS